MRIQPSLRLNAALEERIRWEGLTAPHSELRAVVRASVPKVETPAMTRPLKMLAGVSITGALVCMAAGAGDFVGWFVLLGFPWLVAAKHDARWRDAAGYAVAQCEGGVTVRTGHPNWPEVDIAWRDMEARGTLDTFGVRWVLVRTREEHCFGNVFVLGGEIAMP